MPTAEPKPISNVPLNNNKINQPNKANTLQTEPVIVEISKLKYAVCVQDKDNEKYLVGLENQASGNMLDTHYTENGIQNCFNIKGTNKIQDVGVNSVSKDINKITVNGKSQDIFCGTLTTGKHGSGHTVGIVIHKGIDGRYNTVILNQTTYSTNNQQVKEEDPALYKKHVKNFHANIKKQSPNIQFDKNITFYDGVYLTQDNLASCMETMMYFTDDLIKEGCNVNKALTHVNEEVSLSRMASVRVNAHLLL